MVEEGKGISVRMKWRGFSGDQVVFPLAGLKDSGLSGGDQPVKLALLALGISGHCQQNPSKYPSLPFIHLSSNHHDHL